jgi:hypothetical protein
MKNELITIYQELNNKIQAMRAEATDCAKRALQEATAEYFAKYPHTVEQIFFNLYTPWFNDGESCELTMSDACVVLLTDPDDEKYEQGSNLGENVEYYEHLLHKWELFNADPEAYKDTLELANPNTFHRWYPRESYKPHYESVEEIHEKIQQISSYPPDFVSDTNFLLQFINSLEAEMLEELFGNHVTVRFSASGVTIEEYSHD